MNYLKKTGASQWCDWASALEKMGHDTGSVRGRRDEIKNKIIKYIYGLTTGNLTKRGKGIYKKGF
jgi:hypothetical protein